MSFNLIETQTKSSLLRKRLKNILANYNSNIGVEQREVIINDCINAVNRWARIAYRARIVLSLITLGVYPLIHLIVAAVGRLRQGVKYQNLPLNCLQVPKQRALTITRIIIDSLSEQSHLMTFCQIMKKLVKVDPRGQIWQPMVEHLDAQELQLLGKTAHIAHLRATEYTPNDDTWFWSPTLVSKCRDEYLRRKAPGDAKLLRDHVMYWRYSKAEALAKMNPLALMMACDYKNNLWQGDDQIVNESALEHVWRTGDENFIKLFEELGKDLPPGAFAHRERLLDESELIRALIAQASQSRANGGLWEDFWEIYQHAPHWVFGLESLIWQKFIKDEFAAKQINLFSADFRYNARKVSFQAVRERKWAYRCVVISVKFDEEDTINEKQLRHSLSVKVGATLSSAECYPALNR